MQQRFLASTNPRRFVTFAPAGCRAGTPNLPPSRYEDKVESVLVALVGAGTTNPGMTCFVEHRGQFLANLWHARALGNVGECRRGHA